MAYRRKEATNSLTVKLQALKPTARYELEDADLGTKRIVAGGELAQGLRLTLANPASSGLLIYRELK